MSKHPLLAQRTDSGAIVLIVVGVVVLVPVICLIAVYNRFVKLRQTVGDSWAGIGMVPRWLGVFYQTFNRRGRGRVTGLW